MEKEVKKLEFVHHVKSFPLTGIFDTFYPGKMLNSKIKIPFIVRIKNKRVEVTRDESKNRIVVSIFK